MIQLRDPFKSTVRQIIRLLLIACLIFVGSADAVTADNLETAFDAANRLYEQGDYAEAAKAYQGILQSGHASAPLYFNLGNALFKSAQTGRAVAAYRQGLALSPRDPDLLANLQFARNQVPGPSWQPSRGERWLKKLSLNEWTAATMTAAWLSLALLTLRFLRPAWKRALRGWIVGAVAITSLLFLLFATALYQSRAILTAIVTVPSAAVRFGPLEESANAFTAQNGAELRVLDRERDWLQVTADPRRIGWIRADQVVLSPGP